MRPAPPLSPESIVQHQLDAYNARDLAKFLAAFSEDVQVYRPPAPEAVIAGKSALGDYYATQRFCHEGLHAELLNRIVLGGRVIDHERITGVAADAFEVAVVYDVSDGLIRRMWAYAKG
jgi:hypothetical protein